MPICSTSDHWATGLGSLPDLHPALGELSRLGQTALLLRGQILERNQKRKMAQEPVFWPISPRFESHQKDGEVWFWGYSQQGRVFLPLAISFVFPLSAFSGLDGRKGHTCIEPRACRLWELVGTIAQGGHLKDAWRLPGLPGSLWLHGWEGHSALLLPWDGQPSGNTSPYRNRA